MVFSRSDERRDMDREIARVRQFTEAPILLARHRPVEWVSLVDGRACPLDFLRGKRVLGFAGIGNPGSFQRSLDRLGVEVVRFVAFRDHHWYTEADRDRVVRRAKRDRAEALVTTEKDGVRIPSSLEWGMEMYCLRIEMEIDGGIQRFKEVMDPVLAS